MGSHSYDYVINYIRSSFVDIELKRRVGYMVIIIHWTIALSILVYYLFGPIDTYYYVLFVSIVVFTVSLNYYFEGCIAIRIERELLGAKNYTGVLWDLSYPLFLDLNKDRNILFEEKQQFRDACVKIVGAIIMMRIVVNWTL